MLALFNSKSRNVIVFGDSIACVRKALIGRNKFLYRLHWFGFKHSTDQPTHEASFRKSIGNRPNHCESTIITRDDRDAYRLERIRKGLVAKIFFDRGTDNTYETDCIIYFNNEVAEVLEVLTKYKYVCVRRMEGSHYIRVGEEASEDSHGESLKQSKHREDYD